MCGIAGIVGRTGVTLTPRHRQVVGSMIASLHHRGPDAKGIWESDGGSAILGQARLSIIDVAGSPQPMPSGPSAITYNGEVYNFRELRDQLAGRGVGFHTAGDTEVVLEALRERGASAVDLFDGMFAFGFWDAPNERLILARDPFGIKPLYYAVTPEAIAFASELTPLYAVEGIDTSIDDDAVVEYMLHGYVPSPKSILRGVSKLPPGHVLIYDRRRDSIEVQRYWSATFDVDESMTLDEGLELLGGALDRSVDSHLISDVPVGAFLSGGIDSGLIVSYMVQHGLDRAYTAKFKEEAYDESDAASRVAAHLGARIDLCEVGIGDSVALTDRLAKVYDEPFSDSSSVPTYLVCEAMRRHVTVALSGDGGDEILGGYARYQRLLARATEYPEGRMKGRIARMMRGAFPVGSPVRRRLDTGAASTSEFYQRLQRIFAEEHLAGILRDRTMLGGRVRVSLVSDHFEAGGGARRPIDGAQLCDIATYLPEDCLTKVDRASMAHSLEVRVPILSKDVWSVARRLPQALRVGIGEGKNKVLMRSLAARRLPSDVVQRPKKGFSIPAAQWFRGELMERFRELTSGSDLIRRVCSQEGIDRLMREHVDQKRNHHHRLWNLMMLSLWYQEHVSRIGGAVGGDAGARDAAEAVKRTMNAEL